MTDRRIGFRLKKLLGLSSEPESPAHDHPSEQIQAHQPTDSEPALEGPFFVRYVPMTPLMLQRSGQLPELRTLAGETLQPRSFLQVPLSADVKAREIQIILDDLQGSEDDLLNAFRDESQEWQFAGCSLAEVCSRLFDTLDRLAAAGFCRIIEALAISESDDYIRIDREDGKAPEAMFEEAIADACRGNIAGVAIALKKGLNPNQSGAAGPFLHYPITVTAEGSVAARMEAISMILDQGADIDQSDKNGWTALHAACRACELPVIQLLVDRGVNVNAADNKGWTAYHYLTYEQAEPELFEAICGAGADPDIRSNADGNTALMLAVDRTDTRRVQILLASGANPGIARHDGLTALHMVAVKRNPEIARLLLEAGAPVNLKGGAPDAPPLHQAAACGDAEMVRMLLERGADTALLDVNGHTAIEIADGNGHFEIARLFEDNHAADISAPPERAPFVMGATGFDAPTGPAAVSEPEAEDPFVVERMALLREQAPTIAKTLDDLEQKLAEDPDDVASWKLRGILLQQIGLSDKALACFNKVVELNEDDADAFVYSGQIVLSSSANAKTDTDRTGLLDIARGAFTTALSKDPGHVEAAIGLGVYCITIGHPDEAHTWLDQALENDPSSGKAHYMKGLALNSSGRAEEAQVHLGKAEALGFKAS